MLQHGFRNGLLERKRTPKPKPQVSAPVAAPAVPAVEPAPSRPHLVTSPPKDVPDLSLPEWVAHQQALGQKRADVLRRGAELYGKSEKTVSRYWVSQRVVA